MQTFWARVREHKVIQWGVAYLGAALALAHGTELVTHAFHWPDVVSRGVVLALVVGFPIALTIAWYHGHKGFQQITAGELSIVAVLVLIGAVMFTAALRPEAGVGAASGSELNRGEAPLPQGDTAPPNTVAVLPFRSLDPEQEAFADGLAVQLSDSLARIQGLTVIGSRSSFHFKDRTDDLRTIGEELNVAYVVEGSVQRAGDELRITAELNSTRTGYRQWGDTYEGELDDIFAIQDEITKSVAEALQITLGVGDLGSLPGMTRNFAAYEEYLTAVGLHRESGAESIRSAIEHYERATALDPTFAVAWFALGNAYETGAFLSPEMADEWEPKAAAAVDRLRAVAPGSPLARVIEVFDAVERGSWREAAIFYEREYPALATRYPALGNSWLWGGNFFLLVGRSRDAIRYLERARAAEPLDGQVAIRLGEAYADAGAFEAALAEFDRDVELGGESLVINGIAFVTALASGDRAEIDRRLAGLDTPQGLDVIRVMTGFLDDRAGGAAEVRRLAASEFAEQPFASDILAHWAAYYGEPEIALMLITNRQTMWRPLFSDMRKLPAFKYHVREMGLVEYWLEFGWSDFCRPVGDNDFECE